MADKRLFADVSSYQGAVDVAALKRAGYSALMVKASEGVTIKDSQFRRTWLLCKKAKVEIRIAYHFVHPENNSPEAEMRQFLRTVFAAGARSTDLLVVDVEWPQAGTMTQAHLREWIERAGAYVEKHWGRAPTIYSGGWWWTPSVGDNWRPHHMRGYQHSAYAHDVHTNLPSGLSHFVVIHQFTDGLYGPGPHRLPGIRGNHDVNRWMRGTWNDFRAFARGGPVYKARFVRLRATWRAHLR